MTLQAEYSPGVTGLDAIQRELDETLRAKLGVRIIVELVPPDSLAPLTGAGVLPKARRLEDRRNISI